MSPHFFFSIHDIITGKVTGPHHLTAPVAHELDYFRTEVLESPDLEADLCQDPAGMTVSWSGRHIGARWRVGFALRKDGPGINLRFTGNRLSRFIVAKWIVEPAVRVSALQKGALMTHAATISDGQRAVLLGGGGGAGKTTWALRWLEAGHPFMSDDFSLIKGENSIPYLTPLRLGFRNLIINKSLEHMSARAKLETAIRTAARRAVLGKVKLYFKAPVQQAVPGVKIGSEVPVAGAIFLKPGQPRELESNAFAEAMTGIDMQEMHGFGGSFLEPPDSRLWNAHRERLISVVSGKPCFCLPPAALPSGRALSDVSELIDWIKGIAG